MVGIVTTTGLLQARIRPVCRPQPKRIELLGFTKPAPFVLRPFSGFFNPYPYGCSVLCNHPADCEAKEVLQRAKDSWASEGKALLLPEEMEMIKANLVATGSVVNMDEKIDVVNDTATVPEELFRRYTETDSRPLTPTPTTVSSSTLINKLTKEEFPSTCNPRERTTLVLDLRTDLQKEMATENFTWHALTLKPPPCHRKTEIIVSKPTLKRTREQQINSQNSEAQLPDVFENVDEESNCSWKTVESKVKNSTQVLTVIRRRGKRLRKGKCRRKFTYGQQTEVRDLFEPTETQVSHIGAGSRRTSIHTNNGDRETPATSSFKTAAISNISSTICLSFIEPEILKHLCRELDSDKVEAEFSIRRKIAFEQALRVKGENHSRSGRLQTFSKLILDDTPRVFSRQAARFEILDSKSIHGLTVLEYLSKHVFLPSGKKLIFRSVFNKFQEDVIHNSRCISPKNIREALQDVIGKPISQEQETYLKFILAEIKEPLNFRTWCGLCAAVERLLCPLPSKEIDPATWLERADFETLERKLKSTTVDSKLAQLLRELCNK